MAALTVKCLKMKTVKTEDFAVTTNTCGKEERVFLLRGSFH